MRDRVRERVPSLVLAGGESEAMADWRLERQKETEERGMRFRRFFSDERWFRRDSHLILAPFLVGPF